MQLSVTPVDGPADEASAIRVSGAPPSAPVTITAETTDAAGHRWEARGVFRADAAGTVDLARDAPVSGTYEGVDPTGLLWSMRFASEDVAPVRFAAPPDQVAVSITATATNGEADRPPHLRTADAATTGRSMPCRTTQQKWREGSRPNGLTRPLHVAANVTGHGARRAAHPAGRARYPRWDYPLTSVHLLPA